MQPGCNVLSTGETVLSPDPQEAVQWQHVGGQVCGVGAGVRGVTAPELPHTSALRQEQCPGAAGTNSAKCTFPFSVLLWSTSSECMHDLTTSRWTTLEPNAANLSLSQLPVNFLFLSAAPCASSIIYITFLLPSPQSFSRTEVEVVHTC